MSEHIPSNYDALGTLLIVSVRVLNAAHRGQTITPDLLTALQDAIDDGRNSMVERDRRRFSYGSDGESLTGQQCKGDTK